MLPGIGAGFPVRVNGATHLKIQPKHGMWKVRRGRRSEWCSDGVSRVLIAKVFKTITVVVTAKALHGDF